MAQPPSRASLLGAESTYTDDPHQALINRVRDAFDQTQRQPRAEYPSTPSVLANHPGFFQHQIMGEEEFDTRQRHSDLMGRLAEIQGSDPGRFNQLPFARAFGADAKMNFPPSGPVSPYVKRGLLAQGQPLANAADLMLIPFSAVANAATGLLAPRGELDPLDEAVKRQPHQLNKATFGLASLLPGAPPTEWERENQYAAGKRFDSPSVLQSGGNTRAGYTPGETGTMDGDDALGAFGMEEGPLRTGLGLAAEAALDPLTTGLGVIGKGASMLSKAPRAGLGKIASGLAEESVFPLGITGLMHAPRPRPLTVAEIMAGGY
jgi:hypothetical protein